MAKPFISYTWYRRRHMEWLQELLVKLGFEQPIVVVDGDAEPPLPRVREALSRADCVFAIISPHRQADGKTPKSNRPPPWIEQELGGAVTNGLPVGALCEPGVEVGGMLQSAFASQEVDLDDAEALLSCTPAIVAMALRIKEYVDRRPKEDYPFILEKVHVINKLAAEQWIQYRTTTIAARKRLSTVFHEMDTGMDKSPGLSIQLGNPDEDLKVKSKEQPKISRKITKNENSNVAFEVLFSPQLKPGDKLQYRIESRRPGILPLTQEAISERSEMPGSPPYMKDGLVGVQWDTTRPILELVLEIEASLELGLSAPEVRVYATDSTAEVDEEIRRIGTPELAPRLWYVNADEGREIWTCRVTISEPSRGCTYCLLVRPTH